MNAAQVRRTALTVAVAAVVALTACTDDRPPLLSQQEASSVRTGLDCAELTDAARTQIDATVEFALDGTMMMEGDVATDMQVEAQAGMAEAGGDDSAAVAGEPRAASPAPSADAPATTGAAGEVVAGTNVAEVGVDEADLVKTDGRVIVSVLDGVLRVVTLGGDPTLASEVPLGEAGGRTELFLRGDEAVVLMDTFQGFVPGPVPLPEPMPMPMPVEPGIATDPAPDAQRLPIPDTTVPETTLPETTVPETTVPETTLPETTVPETTVPETTVPDVTITVPPVEPVPFSQGVTIVRFDISDPAAPAELERRTVEGSLVSARMVDGTVRVVVRSQPEIVTQMWSMDPAAIDTALAELGPEDVLPRATSADGGVETLGTCGDVAVLPAVTTDEALMATSMIAPEPGPSTVSVLTVGEDLADLAPATVQGMAETVYASPQALYVASSSWGPDGAATGIHRFDTAGDASATYTGSGTVPGQLLNQYSLSDHGGDLRVVTTVDLPGAAVIEDPVPGMPGAELSVPPTTEGRLTVLRPGEDGTLVEVGHLDGLGPDERVQSVRFMGDRAYVVTFRQTDPLYALDLSDPTAPAVLGELKITGFSQYLHPVGDGMLLGVGREATLEGADTGFKVSLFDVSDPANLVEVDKLVVPDAWSEVAGEPLAFTWDPVAGHAIFPIEGQGREMPATGVWEPDQAAMVVAVDGADLSEVGLLRHDGGEPWQRAIRRSVVVDRDLWTLSSVGLGRSDADAPTSVELVRFGQPSG